MTRDKIYDLAAASPVIIWFGIGVVGSAFRALELLRTGGGAVEISVKIASAIFLSVAIVLLVLRAPPLRKASEPGPILAGVLGCLAPFLVLFLPRATLSHGVAGLLSALTLLGTAAAIYVLIWLGRSFSILPQARALVTDGPYRYVRHPLYLAEFIIILGKALEVAQPWSLAALAFAALSQIARMHYEEKVLCEAFPAYRTYARRTARLIPGLY